MADSENWIKQRAYELWEADGQPHGKHDEHWAQACAEYEARTNSSVKAPTKRKTSAKSAMKQSDASKTVTAAKPHATKSAAKTVSKAVPEKPLVEETQSKRSRKSQPA
ncbi:DUF2934 domain-containing protein [Rhizobium lemnae]|uniref:DUF2934 domain-containing protein n=1 Tax=Rhizobium lemnae TaxID=1214924 RepID=A0ABV8E4L4_9HYPH|nr:DUF2934 domain-containing protein [Rhizobium lemnae]MCJ8507311.1 DUF2934 domain-containing protein [Rhizobium lemnae]